MAQQPSSRIKRFLQTRLGLVLLTLLAFAVVFATFSYVQFFFAIPAFLLFGLAIPIWVGQKRPRNLAILGLVVVIAVAPTANVVYTQLVMTPVGDSVSESGAPFSIGPPLMQNASVSPFLGNTSTNFTWTVTVFPQNRPQYNTTPSELDLYISTCPGATGNDSPVCSAGYTFIELRNTTLPQGQNLTQYNVTFHYRIGTIGIWTWQMGIFTNNSTTKKPFFQLLAGDPQYNGIGGR